MIIVTPLFVHSPHSDSTMAQYRRPAVYWVEFFKQDQKLVDIFDTSTSDFQIFVRIMVNILYVYLEIRIQKDLCPIMNCRCNLNTFLRCYVRKVCSNKKRQYKTALGMWEAAQWVRIISDWAFNLHLIFEISSSKNLVWWTGFFVYFELDFCRLHRQ